MSKNKKKKKEPTRYAVMRILPWSTISVAGEPLKTPPKGPQHYIPVFDDLQQAKSWNGGSEQGIANIEARDEPTLEG